MGNQVLTGGARAAARWEAERAAVALDLDLDQEREQAAVEALTEARRALDAGLLVATEGAPSVGASTSIANLDRERRSGAARTAAELGLGDMLPLDVAVPELVGKGKGIGGKGISGKEGGAKNTTNKYLEEWPSGRRQRF